jgi:hypothetical protein
MTANFSEELPELITNTYEFDMGLFPVSDNEYEA